MENLDIELDSIFKHPRHERMLDKKTIPTEKEINEHIGKKSAENILTIKQSLEKIFEISIELKFPFGNNYGWGYKVSNKSKHLFYIFFEKNSISIMLQIKKIVTEKEMEQYSKLSEEGKKYWKESYPCGKNGGWIHYRITNKKQLKDIGIFLSVKINKKIDF
jgi:hypothetical protein